MRNALKGRSGAAIGVVALIVALSGTALALPGRNSVDSGDIKNGQVKAKDMKIAYLYIENPSGVRKNRAVKGIHKFGDQVYCLDLAFRPKTGSATRSTETGGSFTAPQIGIGPEAASLCGGAPARFRDAVVQVPGDPDSDGTYANFIG